MNTATAEMGLEKGELVEGRLYALLCKEAKATQSLKKLTLDAVARPLLRCNERSQVNELFEA